VKQARKKLLTVFLLCALYAFFLPIFLPQLRLTFFAPFLILAFYSCNLASTLWLALLVGSLVDLFSVDTRFGFYAFNYCLTAAVLYKRKQILFVDSPATLPAMTALFALVATLFQWILRAIFHEGIAMSWKWFATDFIAMPLLDGIYAWLGIAVPLFVLSRIKKPRKRRRLIKKGS
jgi:hypothetical protein